MNLKNLKQRIKWWLYYNLQSGWAKLENDVLEERRAFLQSLNYDKAIVAQKKFRDEMTEEKLLSLRERPKPEDCKHIKGNCGLRTPHDDYAIMCHRHADAHLEVKCMICGKQFDPKDPETQRMMECSTNRPSSSETPARLIYPGDASWT
jgi:hypothetical protein